jgi:hypothetical protein
MAEKTSNTNYVLIDYENVQPKDIALLTDKSFKVKVFLGPHQAKLLTSMVTALHPLGDRLEYVRLETRGRNALDFHIAYYLGELCREMSAKFHIISKDTGFDPLIDHLKKKGMSVERSACIADMTFFKAEHPPRMEEQVKRIIDNLMSRKSSRPRTLKALRSTAQALFKKQLSESQLSALIETLRKRGALKVEGAKVSYTLPSER